jgi:hypothetical protein
MIHIGRAGTKLGSFSEFEVRQGLATGRFLRTDLGWKEGMEDWAPLSQFSEFAPPAPEPMPPLPSEALPGVPADLGGDAAREGLPWDGRKQAGLVPAFIETAWLVLFRPSEAFARMRIEAGIANPLFYNMLGGWFGAIASGIYLVLTAKMQPPPATLTGVRALFYISPVNAMRELWILIALGPIIVTLSVLMGSVIAHLFLRLAGGANKAFHVTLRVFCFSYGSAQLLQVIPIFGNLLSPAWMLVCCVVGLAAAHETTPARSITAMLLFLVACFACCIGMVFLAAGADYQSLRPMLNQ